MNRNHSRLKLLISFPLLVLLVPVSAPGDDALNASIDKGVAYLKAQIKAKNTGQHSYGQVALETYALISSR